MKKVISIFIAAVLALSSVITVFAAPFSDRQESSEINGFINGIMQLVREYDADKDFAVSKPKKTDTAQAFSATQNDFAASASTQNTEENSGDSTDPAYTLQDFQTARLIVRADGNFDDCGALENVSGFEDFHVLQYESPEAAMKAFEKLQSEKNITEVELDLVCTYCGYESTPEDPDIISKDEFLNDWSRDRTQSKRLLEYLAEADIPMKEIVVGVVDTGIDYTHEIFEDRVERTYFNVSSSGNADDEMDSKTLYHGLSAALL